MILASEYLQFINSTDSSTYLSLPGKTRLTLEKCKKIKSSKFIYQNLPMQLDMPKYEPNSYTNSSISYSREINNSYIVDFFPLVKMLKRNQGMYFCISVISFFSEGWNYAKWGICTL